MDTSLQQYAEKMYDECIVGSAIAPELYEYAVAIVPDTLYEASTKEVIGFPIDEALNRRQTRFGRQARQNLTAALFQNEDGSTWQAKLSRPQVDAKKTKAALKKGLKLQSWDIEPRFWEMVRQHPGLVVYRKYESVTGGGSTPYLPAVPASIRQKIGERYGVEVPLEGSFWAFVEGKTDLPIIYTEGAKKALALLSQGYIAIGLYGTNGGYVAAKDGTPRSLQPQIKRFGGFDKNKRPVYLGFDQDAAPKTWHRVRIAKLVFGSLLKAARCDVRVMDWEQSQGKGADDVIVESGADAIQASYDGAETFAVWSTKDLRTLGKYRPAVEIETRYFGDIDLPMAAKLICLKGGKGTGKTRLIARYVAQIKEAWENGRQVLLIAHRTQLVTAICDALGIRSIYEVKEAAGFDGRRAMLAEVQHDGMGLCVASLHKDSQAQFDATEWDDALVLIDECEQVLWEMLSSSTCKANRVPILRSFGELMQRVLSPETDGQVLLADADLSHVSIDAVLRASGHPDVEPYIVRNQWKQSGYAASMFEDKAIWLDTVLTRVAAGDKGLVFVDNQGLQSATSSTRLEKKVKGLGAGLRVLRIDSETLKDRSHPAFGCMKEILFSCDIESRKAAKILKLDLMIRDYDVVICSPSVETGISLDTKGHFDFVAGCFSGVVTADSVRQALMRLRDPVERLIYCASFGRVIGDGDTYWRAVRSTTEKKAAAALDKLDRAARGSHNDDDPLGSAMKDAFAKMTARANAGKLEYFQAVRAGLVNEGCTVTIVERVKQNPVSKEINDGLVVEKHHMLLSHGETLTYETDDISDEQAAKLAKGKSLADKTAQNELERHTIKKRYGLPMSPDLYMLDAHGWAKGLELDYYFGVGREHLPTRDRAKLDELTHDGAVWGNDVGKATLALTIHAFDTLGIQEIIDAANAPDPARPGELAGISDEHPLVVEFAARCLEPANARQLSQFLGIRPPKPKIDGSVSGIALLSKFLKKLGKKTDYLRREASSNGTRPRVYAVIGYDYREMAEVVPESGEVDRNAVKYQCDRSLVFQNWLTRDAENLAASTPASTDEQSVTLVLSKQPETTDTEELKATSTPKSTSTLRIRSFTPIPGVDVKHVHADQRTNPPQPEKRAAEVGATPPDQVPLTPAALDVWLRARATAAATA